MWNWDFSLLRLFTRYELWLLMKMTAFQSSSSPFTAKIAYQRPLQQQPPCYKVRNTENLNNVVTLWIHIQYIPDCMYCFLNIGVFCNQSISSEMKRKNIFHSIFADFPMLLYNVLFWQWVQSILLLENLIKHFFLSVFIIIMKSTRFLFFLFLVNFTSFRLGRSFKLFGVEFWGGRGGGDKHPKMHLGFAWLCAIPWSVLSWEWSNIYWQDGGRWGREENRKCCARTNYLASHRDLSIWLFPSMAQSPDRSGSHG